MPRKNAPQTLKEAYVELTSPHFEEGDFAITLTFKPSRSQVVHDPFKDVREFLKRANRKLLSRKGRKLKCAYAFEWDAGRVALHCHMILENPVDCEIHMLDRIPLLMNCWMTMDCSGKEKANHIEFVYFKPRWLEYIFKRINKNSDLLTDCAHWTLNS